MKIWSEKRFCKVVAEICDYALDQHLDEDTPYWHKYSDEGKEEAWNQLNTASHIIACLTAQRTPLGKHGVETETPFRVLRMWKAMPNSDRKALTLMLYRGE